MPHLAGLLKATAAQDHDAFDELYRHCSARVYGLVRHLIRDRELSAEVTQEVFLSVWQQASRYEEHRGHPMTWLMTITHRRAVDRIRSEESGRLRGHVWSSKNHGPSHDPVAEDIIMRQEHQSVRDCLDRLSGRQREAVDLAYYRGLTYAAVAEELGVPVPTAKTRIRDGLRILRGCLAEGNE